MDFCDYFNIPDRPIGALSGSDFVAKLPNTPCAAREDAICEAILSGNIPDFMRVLHHVYISAGVCVYVLPDYLCVGSDEDFVRVPMIPATAQRIAHAFGATLPTSKLVDLIWGSATCRLDPEPIADLAGMMTTRCFKRHNSMIQTALTARQGGISVPSGIVAGIKKDIVITNALCVYPRRVAIYGWHTQAGTPIQGPDPNAFTHEDTYVDYSHGVRLVSLRLKATPDLESTSLLDVMLDPNLHTWVSREGVVRFVAYPW